MDKLTWQAWGFGFVEMSTATESKQAIVALREPIGRLAPHGQRGEAQGGGLSRTFLTTSWEWVGHFDQNGRDVRGKVTAVLLAIGMRQGGSDFHYGKRCVQAG